MELKDPKRNTPRCTYSGSWTGLYISEVHISISLFVCSFPGGVWNPVEQKRLCYQSCKMVYYPVSNCTWKGTSNLYEKCLRLPAHSVIHARSVPVMPENKRRCTSLGKRHLIRLKSSWREHSKCHFSNELVITIKILRAETGEEGKNFSFDLTGL